MQPEPILTVVALIIESLGIFFCGEQARELLRFLCLYPNILTQVVPYLARLQYFQSCNVGSVQAS
jgi:hypothetical protein